MSIIQLLNYRSISKVFSVALAEEVNEFQDFFNAIFNDDDLN